MECQTDLFSLTRLHEFIGEKCVFPSLEDSLPLGILESVVGNLYYKALQFSVSLLFKEEWENCLRHCKVLLNITWEHLNTGHWKDVQNSWRKAYYLLSMVKCLCEYVLHRKSGTYLIADVVRSCDHGLLMGAPIFDNILAKLATSFQKCPCLERKHKELQEQCNIYSDKQYFSKYKISTELTSRNIENDSDIVVKKAKRSDEKEDTVSIINCPSLEYFNKNYFSCGRPVIVEDTVSHWPAFTKRRWSIPYIKKIAGMRTVPVEIGSKYTEDSWSQSLMTVDHFIDKYMIDGESKQPIGYLAQHNLFDQIPELLDDIIVPEYCALSDNDNCNDVDINAWFGPGGTISPLHQDPKHNLLTQVFGEKYIKLISPLYSKEVYPHDDHILFNTSQVDVMNPDLVKYPLFANVKYIECILRPRQMLYIPPKYWHFVTSLCPSFSVSFWWT